MSGLIGTVGKGHPVQEVVLIPSGGGIFDVFVDEELVYSKHKTGRHAKKGEVLELVKKKLGK